MNPGRLAAVVALLSAQALADRPPGALAIQRGAEGPKILLPQVPIAPVSGAEYRLSVESSADLRHWVPTGQMQLAEDGSLTLPVPASAPQQFFRLRGAVEFADTPADGAEAFGFERVFRDELRRVGWLTPEEFAQQHVPSGEYLERISFDPRTAQFWDAFNADPAVVNQGLSPSSPDWRSFDFRLNDAELELFIRHGFVVSERLGQQRIADVFYRIYNDDLPVFISADSVLHAWHWSFQHILSEIEETQLAFALTELLDGLASALAATPATVRAGPLRDSLLDADYFLAVGRSLLAGRLVEPVLEPNPHVAETLEAIDSLAQYITDPGFPMFGASRLVDFSQYKVRGHYERSWTLSRYFQAYLWTARTDLRVFEIRDRKLTPQSRREMGTAVVLALLLEQAGVEARWRLLDEVVRLFVGRTDAMNFAHLQPLLRGFGIDRLEVITSLDQITALQDAIATGSLGLQLIPGDAHFSPFGPAQAQLPRAFVLTGQRFVPDGWALA